MEENILLQRYATALEKFKRTGYHPHPANLLAMLLLPEKDHFEPLMVCEGVFYKEYKQEIDNKIAKVEEDFKITKQEIIAFIEKKGIVADPDNLEEDKIWFVFHEGFGMMHGEMMYRPDQSDYQIYNYMNNKSKWYKMTDDGLREYPPSSIINKTKIKNLK